MYTELNILLVSEDKKREALVSEALKEANYEVFSSLRTTDDLLHAVEVSHPDVIVIDLKTPDHQYIGKVKSINQKKPTPIVMFVEFSGGPGTIESVVKSGVHAYIVDGFESNRLQPIIETAMVRFNEYQTLKKELVETKAVLEERKKIETAKGLLMEKHQLNEQDAFQTIRKMAMDQNKKMGDVAENIIAMFKFIK